MSFLRSLVWLAALTAGTVSAQTLKIVHFDVGQGSAALVLSPSGQTLLVDAGPEIGADPLQAYFQAQGLTGLTHTVATHYHADHIGEFPDLFTSGWLPDSAWDRGNNPGYSSASYTNYAATAAPVRHTLTPGRVLDLGSGVTARAVCVNGQLESGASYTLNDENERSICLLVEYRNFRYVAAGDLGGGALGLFDLETPCSQLTGPAHVFAVNHHGSASSTNLNWLNTLQAQAAVVSLATGNPYGYTHPEVISRVTADPHLQTLYHTQQGVNLSPKSVVVNGHVTLQTDGLTCFVMEGDTFDLGPDVYLDVWVNPLTVEPIPASGGTLYWNLWAQNLEGVSLPTRVHFWLQVPSYGPYTLINLPAFTLPPLPSGLTRMKEVYIPAGAPSGMYLLWGEIRALADSALLATDCDTFYKAGAQAGDWALDVSSLDFPDDSAPARLAVSPPSAPRLSISPNPFNPVTALGFRLPAPGYVILRVYDTAGREVTALVNGWREAGVHEVTFDGSGLASGVYLVRMEAGEVVQTQKLILLK